jgi:hypothetical protein
MGFKWEVIVNFELVALALSSALGAPLSYKDRVIRLVDKDQNERLILEQLPGMEQVVACAVIGPMVEGEAASQANQYLLQWNADVGALGDSRITADLDKSVYYLIKPLNTEGFRQVVESCESLLNQSEDIHALLQEKLRRLTLPGQPTSELSKPIDRMVRA